MTRRQPEAEALEAKVARVVREHLTQQHVGERPPDRGWVARAQGPPPWQAEGMVKRDEAKPSTERWSAEEARVVLARWRASGLTRTAFAEGQGLNYERLRRWEKRLAGEKESALRLVPVVARETTRSSEGSTAKLQLPGGMMLEFDTGRVDPRWVAALVFDVARGA
jgi:DNA-binding transcriptional regulator YiaG